MSERSLIDKDALTINTIAKCVELYPDVIRAVYEKTRSKSNQTRILETDEWRYALSSQVQADQGLSKDELARLVQWKITHGTHRPFLPGMIDKNGAEYVETCTTTAAKLLSKVERTTSKAEIVTAIKSALTEVCNLKGVGPATGTLILSVFNPDIVPFFQDETYHWITGDRGQKLKYDKKEYATLLDAILDIVIGRNVNAQDLEKTVYVLSHADVLDEEHRTQIKQSVDEEPKGKKTASKQDESVDESLVVKEPNDEPSTGKKRKEASKGTREEITTMSKNHNKEEAPRRSKRKKV